MSGRGSAIVVVLLLIACGAGSTTNGAPCGAASQPCCIGQNECIGGTTCISENGNPRGFCRTCGHAGEPCCDLETCQDGCCTTQTATTYNRVCTATGSKCPINDQVCAGGSCGGCGAIGQPCCTNDQCTAAGAKCANGTCIVCGGKDQRCCSNSPEGCGDNLGCDVSTASMCRACGGADQPCCPGWTCNGGLGCDTHDKCVTCGVARYQPCCANRACSGGLTCMDDVNVVVGQCE